MKSRLLRTFGLVLITMSFLASGLKANNPVFLGYGSDPQWSPSGKLIGAWRGDTLIVFDVQTCKELKSIPVHRPKFCYWISEDTLALSYQGRTEAERPRDRWPTVTRSIVTLDGNYTEILSDTIVDSRNSLSHWRQLPNGKVGVFRLTNDTRTAFLVQRNGRFVEDDPDTIAQLHCWEQTPQSVFAVYPSPSCSLALVFTNDDEALLLSVSGKHSRKIRDRSSKIEGGRYSVLDRAHWSSDGRFLSMTNFIEDGHYLYACGILVLNIQTLELQKVSELPRDGNLEAAWSPVESVLAIEREGSLVLWKAGN